jgi:hypothetical protein
MARMTISGKSIGKSKRPLFEDFSIPLPPDLDGDGGITLRDLITRIVITEVESFQHRQQVRRLTRVLSPSQIEAGIARGKIESGGSDLDQKVDTSNAIGSALQGFEDGLYLVVIDEKEARDLDAQVFLHADSRITFIRLVFLAGA